MTTERGGVGGIRKSNTPIGALPQPEAAEILKVSKRNVQRAQALIEASQRQIARTLGVAEATVRGDLGAQNNAPADPDLTQVDSDPNIVESTGYAEQRPEDERSNGENTTQNGGIGAQNNAPASYSTIVIDPPWPMQFIQRKVRPTRTSIRSRPNAQILRICRC